MLQRVAKRAFSAGRELAVAKGHKLTAINPEEAVHFNQLAQSWWDVNGPQRILHKMNLLRMDFIQDTIKENIKLNAGVENPDQMVYIPPYDPKLLPPEIAKQILAEQDSAMQSIYYGLKLRALDIGCGGGILTESLARVGIVESVKGIDLSEDVLKIAEAHKKLDPLTDGKITYKLQALEDIPKREKYDIVTMMEMLEHVDYPAEVLKESLDRVKVGGWIFLSTINRDLVSWFTTIFVAEHLLKIVPVGTHTLDKYIKHQEIRDWFHQHSGQFEVKSAKGCMYIPAYGWTLTDNANVGNYLMAIQRVK